MRYRRVCYRFQIMKNSLSCITLFNCRVRLPNMAKIHIKNKNTNEPIDLVKRFMNLWNGHYCNQTDFSVAWNVAKKNKNLTRYSLASEWNRIKRTSFSWILIMFVNFSFAAQLEMFFWIWCRFSWRSEANPVENLQNPMVKIITVLNISTVFSNMIVWMKLHAKYPTGDFQLKGKLIHIEMKPKIRAKSI